MTEQRIQYSYLMIYVIRRVRMRLKKRKRTSMKAIDRPELSPDFTAEYIGARKTEIERIMKSSEDALRNAPEGKLRIGRNRKSRQYYLRNNPADKDGVYLRRSQHSLAAALAQKDYDYRLVDELRQESKAIGIFLDAYHPEHVDEIFRALHDKRKPLVMPAKLLDDDYVKRWKSVAYEQKGFGENAPEFYTVNGERVRSKSEIMIADTLSRHGIPYRYEYPIHIAGLGTVHPDFTCLNVRKRKEYVWEHYGMMSDSNYADNAVNRMEKYSLAGYNPGENSIITFETDSRPLSTRIIELNIRRFLL